MPSKAARPCSHAGCPALVTDTSRCPAHTLAKYGADTARRMEDSQEREYKRFYDGGAWRKTRAYVLRTEPWCRECRRQGRVRMADMVDHIDRVRDGGARFNLTNLQPLCNACHAAKRSEESRR